MQWLNNIPGKFRGYKDNPATDPKDATKKYQTTFIRVAQGKSDNVNHWWAWIPLSPPPHLLNSLDGLREFSFYGTVL